MVFSSPVFLFGFLPCFLLAYFLTPTRFRNVTALLASGMFYAWGAPTFIFLLLTFCLTDYLLSLAIHRCRTRPRWPSLLLALSVASNLALLGYFKYANFLVAQFSDLWAAAGHSPPPWTHVALPIGISFFVFHKISYTVDVYRGISPPCRSFIDFLLYILFFPQLIAGPIIRYHDIAEQLLRRTHSFEDFFQGMYRFSLGLGKKVLLANPLGEAADAVFAFPAGGLHSGQAWLGLLCYAFQIYFDFSGYSDMALGLGRMCGFHFRENFNQPYIATTITDFWRRWHISLSSFMKEYLYIPLGGNRGPLWRTYFNLWIVFLISGLWHGASWTFILWGAYHGCFLVLDRLFWSDFAEKLPRPLAVAITFLIVLFGWLLFRCPDALHAWQFAGRMFALSPITPTSAVLLDVFTHRVWFTFVLAAVISFAPLAAASPARLADRWRIGPVIRAQVQGVFLLALLGLSLIALSTSGFNPFIYFRF